MSTWTLQGPEGEHLNFGQYHGEFITKWDCWEGRPLAQIFNTSPSGVFLHTVQVTPPLAALHKDDLNTTVFTLEPKTLGETFFSKTW